MCDTACVRVCIIDARYSYACTGGMLATVCCCIICVAAFLWSCMCINARRSYSCTGGMLAIACCCTVSYIACRCAGVCVMLLHDGYIVRCIVRQACRGSHVRQIPSSYDAGGLGTIPGPACPTLDDTTKRNIYILLCESMILQNTERWKDLGLGVIT